MKNFNLVHVVGGGCGKTTGPVVFAAIVLACVAMAQPNGLTIREASGSNQTARPVTIGRVFKQGEIANWAKPRVNGIPVASWQNDVKNRWPDSSLKYAVISLPLAVSANATVVVDFVNDATGPCHLGNQATCEAAALDGAGMLAQRSSNWTATIEITNGATQTANARTMINAGAFSYWLRGPVVTQMIVRDVSSARAYDMGFATTGGLSPMFIITAYPAYPAGIRQEFVLENAWTDKVIDQTYSLAIKNGAGGSNTVYSRATFTHYPSARWHKGNEANQIWDGTAPGAIEINHNARYLIAAKAFPNYDPDITIGSTVSTSVLNAWNASNRGDDFGEEGTMYKGFATTGGRPDIAWVHQHQLRALYSGSNTWNEMMFNLGDVSGHIPLQLREARTDNLFCGVLCGGGNATVQGTGKPVSLGGRPSFWVKRDYWNQAPTIADRIIPIGSYTMGGWSTDQAHAPSIAYIPYIISGSYYYYEQIMFWANWNTLSSPWHTLYYGRNYEYGIVNPKGEQMRATAWSLRTISQGAFVAVDASPEKELLATVLRNNAEFWEGAMNVTSGNYPPADSSCPGNTPGGAGPTSGANRSIWCFGRKIYDVGRANPNGVPLTDIGQYPCMTKYWGLYDCPSLGTTFGHSWQWAYFIQAIGWANDSVAANWGPTLDAITDFWVEAYGYNPKLAYGILLGTNRAAATLYVPMLQPDNVTRFANAAAYGAVMIKNGSTTLVGSLISNGTSFQMADYTATSWVPIWRRTASAVSSISVTSGTIRVSLTSAHGLRVGYQIMTTGHSTAALNTNDSGTGGVIARRYITAVPSANTLEFAYVGTTPPADGSYSVDSGFIIQTLNTNNWFRVGSEVVQICRLEVDGTATVGSAAATESTASGSQCIASATYRAQNGTTGVAHNIGETVEQAYDVWDPTNRGDTQGGTVWIMRTAMSFLYPYSGPTTSGTSLWNWMQSTLYTPYGAEFQTDSNPTLSVMPRQTPKFRFTTSSLPTGTANVPYSAQLAVSNNTGAVTYGVSSGSLPAGVALNTATGEITGTAAASVASAITFTATDATGTQSATLGLGIQDTGVTITMSPASLPNATVGSSYSQSFSATGGTAPYTWEVIGTGLVPGLTMSGAGLLSGNPSAGGTYNFTVRVTDANSNIKDQAYSITVAWLQLGITTATTLPTGIVGASYSQQLQASGGQTPYTWVLVSGTVAGGLSVVSSGLVSGVPNTPANYSFTVRCTSNDGQTTTKAFTLNVPPPIGYVTAVSGVTATNVTVK